MSAPSFVSKLQKQEKQVKTLQVRLTERQSKGLAMLAKRYETGMSDVLRAMLDAALEEFESAKTTPNK